MTVPTTIEEKTCKKNDVKARSLLLMALPNEMNIILPSTTVGNGAYCIVHIYKEEVIDLLKGDENGKGVGPSHVPIQIRETTNSGILLACVTEVKVNSQEEMMSLMLCVFVRRSTGITNMNSQTSLSPAILLFTWNKNELLAWKVED
ncbi:kinesin-like protein KIN-4C [Tanacetum coccineum]